MKKGERPSDKAYPLPPPYDGEFLVAELNSETPLLDLHGEAADQAWLATADFLDEQAAIGIEAAKVMHGKGMGVLKRMLEQRLPKHPRVKAFRDSQHPRERGAVLIVLLR